MAQMLRIDYDDDAITIMDEVNVYCELYGFRFVDDGKDHDGYLIYKLERIAHSEGGQDAKES